MDVNVARPPMVLVSRAVGVSLLAIACLVAFGAFVFTGQPAGAVTGTAGPVAVDVNPTNHPASGTPVVATAAVQGAELFEIQAHLCEHGANIANTFDFSFSGAYCTPNPVAPDTDVEVIKKVLPRVTQDSVTFRVGQGTGAPWTDLLGQTHSLTCDATHLCDLVLQFQVTDTTTFYSAPLDGSTPPPSTTPPSTANPPERPPKSTVAGVTTTVAGATATTATPAPDGSTGATGTTPTGSTPPGPSSAVTGLATPSGSVAGRAAASSGSTGSDASGSGSGALIGLGALLAVAIGAAVVVVFMRRRNAAVPET